jgi:DNA mismatch repair protein MutL
MNIIKILPTHEAQKIAAGEVVERPASVVKELVENSIDADSTQISIYIEDSGKKLIRIVDNGRGMSQDDALLCFEPHATSKITSIDDLETITSFGFRGEALASISSVSKVMLRTKHINNNSNLGVEVVVEGKDIIPPQDIACNQGCDLAIKDLFYNTPARKKFLKQNETEWNRILNLIYAFCLSNLECSFSLYRDGKRVLHAPITSSLKDRFAQIFGHNIAENLITLSPEQKNETVSISGLISRHEFWRYNKGTIFFFVNNRLVKNTELLKALFAGYSGILPPGKFPAGCLSLTIDTNLVDVNVHPRKEEVAFAKPFTITSSLQRAVKATLEKQITQKLAPLPLQEIQDIPFFTTPSRQEHHEILDTSTTSPQSEIIIPPDPFLPQLSPYLDQEPSTNIFSKPENIQETTLQKKILDHPGHTLSIVGQLFKTYIMIEREDEFVIMDQHAAHERILYEQFASRFEKREGTRLLFPEIITLEKNEFSCVIKQQDFFSFQGIELQEMGENKIAIKTAPPKLHNHNLSEFVKEVAAFMIEHEQLEHDEFKKKLTEHVHSHMSCKAAVKAGDTLTMTEMQDLARQLSTCNNRMICVHGRPTMWTIPKNELEKKFKRKL